jgi:GDP/UDP-N,N'-diacetylbacillosamine 2-epimerase (hydrolysing)
MKPDFYLPNCWQKGVGVLDSNETGLCVQKCINDLSKNNDQDKSCARNSICVVTGSRAEYGLLRPLIARIAAHPFMNLRLVVTGMHLCNEFGNTYLEIENDGYAIDAKLDTLLASDGAAGMVKSTGLGMIAFADYFSISKPDMLIILGDRYEIFAAASAAAMMRIPIAHICGGDTTEGAVDECLRHSISKMSALHFPSNAEAARRLIRMGEPPDRVFDAGALHVERIKEMQPLSPDQLESELEINVNKPYSLVTYHPVTLACEEPLGGLNAMLDALQKIDNMTFIFTKSNADSGGRAINKELERRCSRAGSFRLFPSLGSLRYLSLMRGAKAVIGNSSSALYEAPVFGIPAVNIGDRQKGRLCPDNIINCAPVYDDILLAVKKALSEEFARYAKNVRNPYGDGGTSLCIMNHVNEYLQHKPPNLAKSFYDDGI